MAILDVTPTAIEIPLTKDYTAIVDQQDADLLDFNWYAQVKPTGVVYAARHVRRPIRKVYFMHRIILQRMLNIELMRFQEVDHKDGNGLNNTRANLRLATSAQNRQNKVSNRNNSSGYRGVYWDKVNQKWRATIGLNGKSISLGRFADFEDAVAARNAAELERYGEFSPLNSRN